MPGSEGMLMKCMRMKYGKLQIALAGQKAGGKTTTTKGKLQMLLTMFTVSFRFLCQFMATSNVHRRNMRFDIRFRFQELKWRYNAT